MRTRTIVVASALTLACGTALGKLPAPTDEQKAKAADAKAKADWTAKIDAYQLCLSQDRAAAAYYAGMKARDKPAQQPVATAACVDPGPFVPPGPK